MDTPVAVGWQLGDDRLDLRHEFIVWQRWPADPSPGAKRTDFRLHKPKRLGIFLSSLRLLPRQRFTPLVRVGGRWNLLFLVHRFPDHCDLERLSLPEIKSGRIDGANVRDVGQTVDATTLSWCRRTGISASSRALDRTSLVSAHASTEKIDYREEHRPIRGYSLVG